MEKKTYVILGLGIFGSTIAKTLSQFGNEVLAIDKNPDCVQRLADTVTKAVVGDITDMEFLQSLGVEEFDVGVVAIGSHLEEALLAVLNLKELGVPHIIAKAKNKRALAILEKIGADRIVRPEKEMGEKIARSLLHRNITDLIEIDEKYSICEMKIPQAWVGKNLIQLNLRQTYGINILGKKNMVTHKLDLQVDPETPLSYNDHFLLLAETTQIEKMDYLL